MTTVYQSACLARGDTVRPLIAVGVAALANLAGDCALVLGLGLGASGAAAATALAQVAAWFALMKHEGRVHRSAVAATAFTVAAGPSSEYSCSPPLLADSQEPPAMPRRGRRDRVASGGNFLGECLSPASALASKSAVVMTLMATASGCGLTGLAAHQVCQSINCLFLPFGESLSQTVQALLPRVNAEQCHGPPSRRLSPKGRTFVRTLGLAALGLGSVNALFAGSIPLFGARLFTSDAAVAAQMAGVAPFMMTILLLHAFGTMLEGVLFTTGDASFLGRLYPLNTIAVCGTFAALRASRAPLPRLWQIMAMYNVVRVVQFIGRLTFNQRPSPEDAQLSPLGAEAVA